MRKRLNKILKKRKITQVELAERLDISPAALSSRLKNPTLTSIKEIAKIVECEVSELIDDTNKIQLIINDELHTFYSIDEFRAFTENL